MTSSWHSRWPLWGYALAEQSTLSVSTPQPVTFDIKSLNAGEYRDSLRAMSSGILAAISGFEVSVFFFFAVIRHINKERSPNSEYIIRCIIQTYKKMNIQA